MVRRYSNPYLFFVFTIAFSLINSAVAANSEQSKKQDFDLILAGGGLATCSSLSEKNCHKGGFSEHDLTEILYQFSAPKKQNFHNSTFYLSLTEGQKQNINSIIEELYATHSNKKHRVLSKSQVRAQIKSSGLLDIYQNLTDELYFALFDYFEFRQIDNNNQRQTEKVDLSKNRNQGTKRVYTAFYESARIKALKKNKSKPTLIAITASSRDPFESADFYRAVLNQFDANVVWLPLDMNLQQAIEQNRCDELESIRNANLLFNRNTIYPKRVQQQYQMCIAPEKLLHLIKQADGVMFNGGDQSRTLAALTKKNGNPTQFLLLLKKLNLQKQLVVAGTSAGTAVQAGGVINGQMLPMLTNGSPELALKRGAFKADAPSTRCSETSVCGNTKLQPGDLTYHAQGGTGLFPLGLVDTHFSERDREVRLSVFAHETHTQFGFGVDEATALAVRYMKNGSYNLEVIGENGVFITDIDKHPSQLNQAATPPNYVSGIAHFLNEGDKMTFEQNGQISQIKFADSSERIQNFSRANHASKRKGDWRANTAKYCGSRKPIKWQKFKALFLLKAAEQTSFAKNQKSQCSYFSLPYVISL